MKSKVISIEQAVNLIKNGSTVAVGGFVGCAHPEQITLEIEKQYLEKHTPNNLIMMKR